MKSLLTRLAAAALIAPLPMVAPATAAAQETDGYRELVGAVASDNISFLIFERDLAEGFTKALMQDAEIRQIETDCPGYVGGMTRAVRSIMRKSHEVDYAWYRAQLEQLLRDGMSEAEARGAAGLFGSELGQRFLTTAIANYAVDGMVSDVMGSEDGVVSREAMDSDRQETVRRLMQALSPEDIEAFTTRMGQAPWFPAFIRLQPRLNQLQLELANREIAPDLGAEFDKIVGDYAEAELEKCYGGK